MKVNVPSAESKIRHAKLFQRLTKIMHDGPPPRVETSTHQRVVQSATLSNDTISPMMILAKSYVHQHVTRSNTPMQSIMEVDKPSMSYDATGNTNNRRSDGQQAIIPPSAQGGIRSTGRACA